MCDKAYQDEFELILYAGNAKSKAMMALMAAKENAFQKALLLIEDANHELLMAHEVEKRLVVKEANGEKKEIGILMIHAQDHLLGATLTIEQVTEWIHIYEEIELLKKR